MEYMVLAYKEGKQTYRQSTSLDQAYDKADELKEEGWKIESVIAMVVKDDFAEDYESINMVVKRLCKDYKKESSRRITKSELAEIKEEIIDKLDEYDIKVQEAQYYIESMIEDCLEWDGAADIISSYVEKKLANYYRK